MPSDYVQFEPGMVAVGGGLVIGGAIDGCRGPIGKEGQAYLQAL
jgi:hypothetical protein